MFDRHIEYQASIRPEAPAVIIPSGAIPYRKFNHDIDRAVRELKDLSVPKGQSVSVAVRDPYIYAVLILALARRGIASAQAADTDAEYLICEAGREDGRPGLIVTEEMVKRIWSGPRAEPEPVEPDPQALARVYRTSGTTGESKRVGPNWSQFETYIADIKDNHGPVPSGPWLAATGLDIGYGLFVAMAAWAAGNSVVLGFGSNLPEAVRRARPTLISVVPFQLVLLLDALPPDDPPGPIYVLTGGGPVPPAVAKRAGERFGSNVRNIYGASETGGICGGDLALLVEGKGRAGKPLPGVRLEIRGEDGKPVPKGELGRVFVAGDRVLTGYLNDPERTAAAFRDGWYDTGDMGRISDDDILALEGRADDIMNIGGHKILPRWIEDAALSYAGTADAAAFSVEDAEGIERCYLALVRKPDFNPEGIRAALARQLAFVREIQITIVDEIPRNAMGKIERDRLVESLEDRLPPRSPSAA
jgi:long-chain acyl-CoA synthetase